MTQARVTLAAAVATLSLGVVPVFADEIRHDLHLRLDPHRRMLEVEDTILVPRLAIKGRFRDGVVPLGLDPRFAIGSLRLDGRPVGAPSAEMALNLAGDGNHRVEIAYRGELPPLPPDSGRGTTVGPVADATGTFLPEGSGWYPRLGGTTFAYRLTATVPNPQRAVVPGRLVEETVTAQGYRVVFASEGPAEGIALMAGPWRIDERQHGAVKLRTYFAPAIEALAANYLDSAATYIDRYSRVIGDYPFAGFAIVSGPLPVGLGYPGLTYMGERVLALPFIRSTSLGHEVLHNWWGNGVRIGEDSGNWAEGLTTFMADYAFAEDRGSDAALELRFRWLRNYAALPSARDLPARSFVAKIHDASQVLGYEKVAFLFHMLRRKIGVDSFNEGIRLFWNRHRFQAAAWNDLQRAFEDASHRELNAFFTQWLDRIGAPCLRLVRSVAERSGPSYGLKIWLEQDDPPYALTVPVRVATADGIERFAVPFRDTSGQVVLAARQHPLDIAIDPDFDVFRRLDEAEAPPILRDVTLDPEALVVVLARDQRIDRAGRELASRLADQPPRFVAADPQALPSQPLVVIGLTAEVERFANSAGLPTMRPALTGKGSGRSWADRYQGRALLFVVADDVAALEAMAGPLPHYLRSGYIVFDGARVIDRGDWPAGERSLARCLNQR